MLRFKSVVFVIVNCGRWVEIFGERYAKFKVAGTLITFAVESSPPPAGHNRPHES